MPQIITAGYIGGMDSSTLNNIKHVSIMLLTLFVLLFILVADLRGRIDKHDKLLESINDILQKNNKTLILK